MADEVPTQWDDMYDWDEWEFGGSNVDGVPIDSDLDGEPMDSNFDGGLGDSNSHGQTRNLTWNLGFGIWTICNWQYDVTYVTGLNRVI